MDINEINTLRVSSTLCMFLVSLNEDEVAKGSLKFRVINS